MSSGNFNNNILHDKLKITTCFHTNDFICGTINYKVNQLTLTRGWQTNKLSPTSEGDRIQCQLLVNQ